MEWRFGVSPGVERESSFFYFPWGVIIYFLTYFILFLPRELFFLKSNSKLTHIFIKFLEID